MPLNILLADDSVPAQNMGKKILMDAGYGVVTVSNGLEALRKIADAVPDMAILDIFMPGYTGLEICKRLRSSAATASVPVILTVGRLEPYRPEDGEQVQSNAVIVKPFAAAELISAVRSLIGGPLADTQTSAGPEAKSEPESAIDPLTADHPATPEEPAGAFQGGPSDEPIFANAASEVGSDSELLTAQASSAYGGAFLLSGADSTASDSNGAANLAFDPDATHTPFSASVIETLAPASSQASENSAYAVGEFELETVSSAYSAAEPEISTVEEPSLSSSPAHEAAVREATATAELESRGLEVSALDPLLELSADAAAAESDATSDAVQLSPEEEARMAAFEALFNSPEPLPLDSELLTLDDFAAPQTEAAPVAMASILDAPNLDAPNEDAPIENAYAIEPEPESEAMANDNQEHFATQFTATHFATDFAPQGLGPDPLGSAPYQFEEPESDPLSAIGTIPDPVPELLDEVLAPTELQPAPELAPEASQAGPAEIAPLDAAPLEAVLTVAVLPGVVSSEVVLSEVVLLEAPEPAPELLCSELDSPLDNVAPVQVEAAPVQLAEPAALEPLEPTQPSPEQQPEFQPDPQPEPSIEEAEISSPPGLSSRLNEAERIHHAIELVFDRFRPLLVAAIVRELARQD